MNLVELNERTPATAYTNTARYATRPFGLPIALALSGISLGLTFALAESVTVLIDLTLWT